MATGIIKCQIQTTTPAPSKSSNVLYDNNVYKKYGNIVLITFNFKLKSGTYTSANKLFTGLPKTSEERFILFKAVGTTPESIAFAADNNGGLAINNNSGYTLTGDTWIWGQFVYITA